jgi:hypothetical protein
MHKIRYENFFILNFYLMNNKFKPSGGGRGGGGLQKFHSLPLVINKDLLYLDPWRGTPFSPAWLVADGN